MTKNYFTQWLCSLTSWSRTASNIFVLCSNWSFFCFYWLLWHRCCPVVVETWSVCCVRRQNVMQRNSSNVPQRAGKKNTFISKKEPKLIVFITYFNCKNPNMHRHFQPLWQNWNNTHQATTKSRFCKNPKTHHYNQQGNKLDLPVSSHLFLTVCTLLWQKMGRRRW